MGVVCPSSNHRQKSLVKLNSCYFLTYEDRCIDPYSKNIYAKRRKKKKVDKLFLSAKL